MFEYYDREKLYQEVWEKPMSEVCKSYGISDVALKKACKKLRVATPPRGYWAKVANGQSPLKPKLIPFENPPSILIRKTRKEEDTEPKLVPEAFIQAERLIQNLIETPLPGDLEDLHPYVRNTRKVFKRVVKEGYEDDYNRVSVYGNDGFDLNIGADSLDRASIILQAICSMILNNGFKIVLSEKNAACFQIMDELIEIEIFEESKKIMGSRTTDSSSRYAYRDYDYIPTGVFKLEISSPPYLMKERKSWHDSKTKRIEDKISDIVRQIIKAAAWKKEAAAKRLKEKEEWRIKEEQRAEIARLKRVEDTRIDRLQAGYKKWMYHRELSEYVNAVKSHYIKNKGEPDGDFAKWVEWAEGYLKKNDPLNDEYLKFEVPEKPFWM